MQNTVLLKQKNLAQISDRISIPFYNRDTHIGIVHIGVGGFHRSHLAYYTHELLQKYGTSHWAICGAGIREGDRKMNDVLRKQDGLYTLITKHPDGKIESEIIGSIVDFQLGINDPGRVISRMAHPDIKIVSLTITEGGYNFSPTTGAFDFNDADIQYELNHPTRPKTIYGYLTAALKERRDAALPAFTIMSCDNIQCNGDVTKKMLLSFAQRQDASFANWIEQEVCFPNSMVDRITPVTTQSDIDYLDREYGIIDTWPVTCEPFIQWVVEDNFSDGRPEYEKVGVQFVSDVKPYEKMKLRLLNAGHSVIGILGAIHGHETINACMDDEIFVAFLRAFLDREASSTLDDVKGMDLVDYKDSLLKRFANPNISDNVSRICSESSAKLPKFLIPTITENLANGGSIQMATLVIAGWCYYHDKRVNKDGQQIEIIDTMSAVLHTAASQTQDDPLAFIKQEAIFGDLFKNERFATLYVNAIHDIYKYDDIRNLMKHWLEKSRY